MIAVRTVVAITNPPPTSSSGSTNPAYGARGPRRSGQREIAQADHEHAAGDQVPWLYRTSRKPAMGPAATRPRNSGARATIPNTGP